MNEPFFSMVPESLRARANNLACVLGWSMADLNSYVALVVDPNNSARRFYWAGVAVDQEYFDKLTSPLVRPAFDTEQALDVADAQDLLDNALWLDSAEIFQEGYEPVDISANLVFVRGGVLPPSVYRIFGLAIPPGS
jgi:hypothetical protein